MKNHFNNFWKVFAGGATVLTYQAFYDSIFNKKSEAEILNKLTEYKKELVGLSEKIDNCKDPALKEILREKYLIVRDNIQIMKENFDKIREVMPDSENSKLLKEYADVFLNAFNKADNTGISILDLLKENKNKFWGENSILDLISNYSQYLSNLSTTELCLIINISTSIFILTCLISILFAFYGNFLLDKFSLEKRYPKLSGIIKLRIKLQNYYILINTLFIVISLILLIGVNILTFIHGDL
jgi:hypothetical protein